MLVGFNHPAQFVPVFNSFLKHVAVSAQAFVKQFVQLPGVQSFHFGKAVHCLRLFYDAVKLVHDGYFSAMALPQ